MIDSTAEVVRVQLNLSFHYKCNEIINTNKNRRVTFLIFNLIIVHIMDWFINSVYSIVKSHYKIC